MMKKIISVCLVFTWALTIIKAQVTCNQVFNYGPNDVPNPYSVVTFPSILEGYLFGHNAYGDIGKAEFFNNPYALAQINSARLKFAVAKTNNPNATISVKVWDNTGLDGSGNPGAPGTVLRTVSVPINAIPTNGNDLVITFTPPVSVTTDFFVGITYTYANGDTVALYANNDGLTVPGTSWEQWGPSSIPEVWYALRDSNNTWGINNSIFISVDLCSVCPLISLNVSSTNNTSCISPNGTITVSASGGMPPYTYANGLSNNTSGQFTGLSGGTYTLTVTDAAGCTATTSVTINNPTPPAITFSNIQPNTACTSPYNGSVSVTISDGTPPYSFSTSNGLSGTIPSPVTIPINGLAADTYSVTVTDANNCSIVSLVTINNNLPTISITLNSSSDNTSCTAPNGSFQVTASGGAGGFTYAAAGQTNNTGLFTGLAAGTYTVTATGTDGCSDTLSVTISDNTPTITIITVNTSPNSSCTNPNGSFEVTASGGAGGFTYAAAGQTNNTGLFTGLAAGTYTVTATDTDGCSGTLSITVSDNTPAITVIISGIIPNTSCSTPNGAFTMEATGGTAPYFIDAGGSAIPLNPNPSTFSPVPPGNYDGFVIDDNGCSGSFSFLVPDLSPSVDLTIVNITDNTLCVGANGTLEVTATSGTAPFTYTLLGPLSFSNQTGLFNNLPADTYTVTVIDDNGCQGSIDVTVADNTAPLTVTEIDNQPNTVCVNYNGSLAVLATGGSGDYAYNNGLSVNTTGIFTGLPAGTYQVTATDDNTGCSGIIDVVIADNIPEIVITEIDNSPNTSCTLPNGSFTLEATGSVAPYTYNNGLTTNTVGIFTGLPSGLYSVTVTASNGCSKTKLVSVDDNTPIINLQIVTTSPNTSCITPNGSITLSASGGTSPYTYTGAGSTNTDGSFSGLAAGSYSFTVIDSDGCSGNITGSITDNTPVIQVTLISSVNNTSCTGGNGGFSLQASGGTPPYTYSIAGINNNTGIFTSLSGGSYSVTVTDDTGCTSLFTVNIANNLPNIVLTTSSTPASSATSADGSATVSATGGAVPYSYNWSNGASTSSIFNIPAGIYTVVVADANGCTASDTVYVDFFTKISLSEEFSEALVYPNPSTGMVNLSALFKESVPVMIEVFGLKGEVILRESIGITSAIHKKFDWSSYDEGMYLVKIMAGERIWEKKLLIVK